MKHKRLFALALALALCMALPLAACSLKPAATWESLRPTLENLCPGGAEPVKGSGNVVDAQTPLPTDLDCVKLRVEGFSFRGSGALETALVIDESLDRKIVLTADDNIAERISVRYDAATGEIHVGPENHRTVFSPTKICVTVGAPVREIFADGLWKISYDCPSVKDCRLTVEGSVNGDFIFGDLNSLDMNYNGLSTVSMTCKSVRDCRLYVDGSLNGKFDFGEMDSLDVNISGLSTMNLSGTVRRAALRIDGGGTISAFGLIAQDADVSIEGLGNCEITAERSLNASIDGGGRITYAGDPAVTRRIDGLGSIRAK